MDIYASVIDRSLQKKATEDPRIWSCLYNKDIYIVKLSPDEFIAVGSKLMKPNRVAYIRSKECALCGGFLDQIKCLECEEIIPNKPFRENSMYWKKVDRRWKWLST